MRVNVPVHAEKLFAMMCAESGFVCNKSNDQDEEGWDFIVEVPSEYSLISSPADRHPGSQMCLVQVKSAISGKTRTSIKLSNALKYSRQRLPTFIVLFSYDLDIRSPPKVYIRHWWSDLIEMSLLKIRTQEAKGFASLNRKSMSINFSSDDAPQNCMKLISDLCSGFGKNYIQEKQSTFESVGYKNGYGEGTISFNEKVSAQNIINMQLGLEGPVEISRFTLVLSRFGIPESNAIIDICGGLIDIKPMNNRECQVVLMPVVGGEEVVVDAELVSAHFPSVEKEDSVEFYVHRVKSGIFDILINSSGSDGNFRLKLHKSEIIPINVLFKYLVIQDYIRNGKIRCSVLIDGNEFHGSDLDFGDKKHYRVFSIIRPFMIHMIEFITRKKESREILTSVERLNPIIGEICEYSQLLSGNINRIAGEPEGPDMNQGDLCIFIAMSKVVIENNTFVTIVKLDAIVSKSTDLNREFKCTKSHHISTMVLQGGFESNSAKIYAEMERFAVALTEGALPVFLMGDVAGRIFHS